MPNNYHRLWPNIHRMIFSLWSLTVGLVTTTPSLLLHTFSTWRRRFPTYYFWPYNTGQERKKHILINQNKWLYRDERQRVLFYFIVALENWNKCSNFNIEQNSNKSVTYAFVITGGRWPCLSLACVEFGINLGRMMRWKFIQNKTVPFWCRKVGNFNYF